MSEITPQEHTLLEELLYLESDGELSSSDRLRLERHLEDCADCRAERLDLAAMNEWLSLASEEVDSSLVTRVMEALPAAGWETRHPRTWWPAAAILTVLSVGAALVAGLGTAAAAPGLSAARAVLDLLAATTVAGAGLLGASWQGLGLALGELFGDSKLTLAVFAVFVVGVDFLFIRFLLVQPRRALSSSRRRP